MLMFGNLRKCFFVFFSFNVISVLVFKLIFGRHLNVVFSGESFPTKTIKIGSQNCFDFVLMIE